MNDLHKKFEELNEEVSAALHVQQDAVATASAFEDAAILPLQGKMRYDSPRRLGAGAAT